ncbi:SusC/RagA family TonB-linked outer membrane protein [Pollutibacter soli]|uniref:SusC/RagA family TonB-linked outer membrane protein n=1 Tax=Pollutibacter soli TaxID=3034157 RepID=UPI0030139BC0
MRKLLSLLMAAMLISVLAFSQAKTVSGTVTDESGSPIPFATIMIKGQKTGITADAEGKFIIKANAGDVLVITATNHAEKEVTVGEASVIPVTLTKSSRSTLDEVVVTSAFGLKKAQRTASYSSQVITSENLNIVRQTNVNNALAGKVAGVQARGQSGAKLGSEAYLRIRGGMLLGDTPPIYVVDGTIVGSYDINPDDVEDVSVLKGANATALFGSQAIGGAIVITTKKRGARAGAGIEINSGVTWDKAYVLPKWQDQYAGGSVGDLMKFTWVAGMPDDWKALDGKFYHDYTDDASWGPRMVGQEYIPWYAWFPGHDRSFQTAKLTPQPDNARDFWNTGLTTNNNISFSKSGTGYNLRASYTNQYIEGILPNSYSKRNTFFVTGSFDLNEHFTVAANVNYSGQLLQGDFDDGYANGSAGNFNQWFHRDLDMNIIRSLTNLKSPYGTLATWNLRFNPDGYNPDKPADFYKANYWYNQYANFTNTINPQNRNRFWGDIGVTYKIDNHFRVRGTVRRNQLDTYNEGITTSLLEQSALQTGVLAGYATSATTLRRTDYELLGLYNQTFGDFGVNAQVGGNIFTYQYQDVFANTNQGLNVPDLYAISNSKATPSIGNSRLRQQINSAFASADLEYKKLASINFAVRNDWNSTLPESQGSLFYPSAGATFAFSELFGNKPGWFNFAKVFGSWGKKPVALDIYQSNFTYGVNQFLWGTNFLMGTPNNYPDPNLKGALITTIEAGLDFRFLKNRLGFNVVYYNEKADKIPVNVTVSGVSGFTSSSVNAAVVERQGIEFILNGKAVSTKDWNLDLSANFSYLISNPVKEIYGETPQILVAGGSFGTRFARMFQVKGEDWGQLQGGAIKRNAAGQAILDPTTGAYLNDPTHNWGSVVPKINGGFLANLSFKQFTLGFALDYQVGGQFFSLSEMWGHYSGLMEKTAALNDKGINVRTPVADGGGVHVVGVSSVDEKTAVDMYVDAQTYYHNFYNNQIAEPYVHKLSYLKLRELSLGYNVPVKSMNATKNILQAATISVMARNPWLIWSEARNFDPSEVSALQGEDGQMPGTRGIGVNLKLVF